MLGAIYIGLSGMNAFSRGLQAISNNVANLNSPGYKASSVSFRDAFNVGGLGSAYGNRHNQFAGSGVRFGAQSIDFTQGDMRQSGGDLDLAVQGDGFLVLSGENKTYYARTGQFTVDEDGYISLLGTKYHLNKAGGDGMTPFNIDSLRTRPPTATQTITLRDNLKQGEPSVSISDIAVYDSAGTRHVWKMTLTPSTEIPVVANKWTVTITNASGTVVGAPQTLQFENGFPTTPQLTIQATSSSGDPMEVKLDFTGVTQFSSAISTMRVSKTDGSGLSTLTSVTITEEGHVKLTYSNNDTEDLGAVALASFRDPQQLERLGNGLFRNNGNPGLIAGSEQEGMGTLVSKQIEASNVDLSQQFGDLILIQRGFQASSQIVSVSNDMIQQLFGIRGQG